MKTIYIHINALKRKTGSALQFVMLERKDNKIKVLLTSQSCGARGGVRVSYQFFITEAQRDGMLPVSKTYDSVYPPNSRAIRKPRMVAISLYVLDFTFLLCTRFFDSLISDLDFLFSCFPIFLRYVSTGGWLNESFRALPILVDGFSKQSRRTEEVVVIFPTTLPRQLIPRRNCPLSAHVATEKNLPQVFREQCLRSEANKS